MRTIKFIAAFLTVFLECGCSNKVPINPKSPEIEIINLSLGEACFYNSNTSRDSEHYFTLDSISIETTILLCSVRAHLLKDLTLSCNHPHYREYYHLPNTVEFLPTTQLVVGDFTHIKDYSLFANSYLANNESETIESVPSDTDIQFVVGIDLSKVFFEYNQSNQIDYDLMNVDFVLEHERTWKNNSENTHCILRYTLQDLNIIESIKNIVVG